MPLDVEKSSRRLKIIFYRQWVYPMEQESKNIKIFLPFDFTQNPIKAKHIVDELKIWYKRLECEIHPVSVVSKFVFNFLKNIGTNRVKQFQKIAHLSLKNYMSNFDAKEFLPAEILFSYTFSGHGIVNDLSKYSDYINGQLIVASTRGKKLRNLLRLSGFTKTLLVSSRLPLLRMFPFVKPSQKIATRPFPINFSLNSMSMLSKIEPWAKAFETKILLFDRVEAPGLLSDFVTTSDSPYKGSAAGEKLLEQVRFQHS